MHYLRYTLKVALWSAVAMSCLGVGREALAGGCGCRHHHAPACVSCQCCCDQGSNRSTRGSDRDRGLSRDIAPTTIVQTMPMFAMPMMFTGGQVVQASANRSIETSRSESSNLDARMDRLEGDVRRLATAMSDLQEVVNKQTQAMTAINKKLDNINGNGE